MESPSPNDPNWQPTAAVKADQFCRVVRDVLNVLERLAAHAGVESDELDRLINEWCTAYLPGDEP